MLFSWAPVLSRFSERVQFDLQGNKLPAGSPFIRNFGLQEWDFFTQDSWKVRPSLTLTYGIHYAVQTPPYERNGIQVNWTEDLGQRWREMRNTTKTADQFPLLATQLAGRANRLADYYRTDTNNVAPRASLAWSPHFEHGPLELFADKGGPMVVRAGYALTYDRIGGRFARDAATLGSIGLLNAYSLPGSYFSVDSLNAIPRAPRIGSGGSLPREAFPTVTQTNFQVPAVNGGPGSLVTAGVDPGLHSPTNHLLNVTVSKELPGDWIVEASYIGRFARDLVGVVDLASPPNVRDAASGMTWYEATNEVFTRYMQNRTPVNDIQPIDWYENVYPEIKGFVESRLGRTFASTTQAWYAYLLQQNPSAASLTPGPNVTVSQIDRWVDVERALHKNKVLSPQVQYLGLFGNFSRSNYSSGQFSGRKRFGHGVTLTMNYTLAKSLDTTSAAEAQGFRPNVVNLEGVAGDPLNPSRSYALSDFDRRHTFNTNFVADLPIGRGRLLGGNASPILDRVIGGWQVSGVGVAATGRPWDFTSIGRYNRHYVGRDQPQLVAPVPFELTKSAAGVFIIPGTAADRAKIAAQDFQNSYAGGPVARNQGRGPGYWNVDFSATKNINVGENRRLRLRWEAFNLFNHPNFEVPSPANDGGHNIDQPATLGKITTTLGTERVMQFSFRLEF